LQTRNAGAGLHRKQRARLRDFYKRICVSRESIVANASLGQTVMSHQKLSHISLSASAKNLRPALIAAGFIRGGSGFGLFYETASAACSLRAEHANKVR